ncbi:MAG: branched-chain amino acid transporter system, permease protein [Pseudomonadota bacterium]
MDSLGLVLLYGLNALQQSMLLFLLASGLSLILGAMGVINLAHGALYMLGAYLGLSLVRWTQDWLLALGMLSAFGLMLGVLLERGLIRNLVGRDPLRQVLLTFGLVLVAEEVRAVIWGNDVQTLAPPDLLSGGIPLGPTLLLPLYELVVLGLGLLAALALSLTLRHSSWGLQLRALSDNPRLLAALGVNPARLTAGAFALGAALAMIGGLLAAPLSSLGPQMGNPILIASLVVVILGGQGSVVGTLMASLLVGSSQTLGQVFGGDFAGLSVYVAMVLVLALRPRGLFQ